MEGVPAVFWKDDCNEQRLILDLYKLRGWYTLRTRLLLISICFLLDLFIIILLRDECNEQQFDWKTRAHECKAVATFL